MALLRSSGLQTARAADLGELNDLVARTQFDYYTADARALALDVQAIAKFSVDDSGNAPSVSPRLRTWKLAEILRQKDKSGSRHAAGDCSDATDKGSTRCEACEHDSSRCDARRTVCNSGGVCGRSRGVYRAGKAIDSARALQPTNPRVLLVDATIAIARAKSVKERSDAEKVIVAAVAAFDAQPPQPANVPDWGHAEALARLVPCGYNRATECGGAIPSSVR